MVLCDSYLSEISKSLHIPQSSVKTDFQKFKRNRRPSYQEKSSMRQIQEGKTRNTERLTTAEDDLLYCLLHDVRLGRSLAQIIDPSWLDTKVITEYAFFPKFLLKCLLMAHLVPLRWRNYLNLMMKDFISKAFFSMSLMRNLSRNYLNLQTTVSPLYSAGTPESLKKTY